MRKLICAAAIFIMCAIVALWVRKGSDTYYPEGIAGCVPLPISQADRSNDVVAKLELDRDRVPDFVDWYKRRGFHSEWDSKGIYGYGPRGLSFGIFTTNGAITTNKIVILVVKQWKDF